MRTYATTIGASRKERGSGKSPVGRGIYRRHENRQAVTKKKKGRWVLLPGHTKCDPYLASLGFPADSWSCAMGSGSLGILDVFSPRPWSSELDLAAQPLDLFDGQISLSFELFYVIDCYGQDHAFAGLDSARL